MVRPVAVEQGKPMSEAKPLPAFKIVQLDGAPLDDLIRIYDT